ncbi:ABC transporter substrate-binding protein [Deinococcus deserti]|uniref:Putative dipeptide ABC transporter, periplasmic component n=1 Tax=Deinococcus deserti (strain DSM 17065 / CIP 109153 / LMG 22923 / VCD115) TaxID=546414 RepID=C1D3V1_DEIDV|nr:ABC transporter substrate-binding protein [Deinococcus deserti]ACO48180.1 putative dipeptide ABC transporter, periplasmic component [Deinococcus deserti VCD115]
MRHNRMIGFALTILLSGLSVSDAQTRGGTLRVGGQADIVGLDPHTVSAASSAWVAEQIYDSLLTVTPTGEPAPSIAQKWTVSSDGRTYTFNLRPNVKFSDGKALTSKDVVYSLKRITDPKTASPRQNDLGKIASITAPNATTVVIKLKEPFAPFLTKVGGSLMGIMPSGYAEANDVNKKPMGSGPFKYAAWVPGDSVTLERNPHYWEAGKPYLDKVIFKALKDDVTRITNVQTGTVDLALSVPQNQVDTLKKSSSIKLVGGAGTWYDYLGLNLTKKPFGTLKVRQAISLALNRDVIVRTALFGKGTPINCGPIPPSHWAYADCKVQVANQARAKQLLSEAGFANGFDMTIKVGADYKSQVNIAQSIQAQLKPLKINVKVMPMEWGSFLNDFNKKNFDAVVLGWIGSVDPDDYLYYQFRSGEKFNAQGFSDKTVDQLLDQGRRTVDKAKRREIYRKAQQRIAEQVGYVFLHINDQYEAFRPNVQGYVHYSTGSLESLKDTFLKK